jgi:probable addiction module antidote protein
MSTTTLTAFDIAEYLDSDEAIAEYLTQVLSDGDSEEFLRAVGHVARARGISDLARKSGLGRESLYKTLRPKAKPRFETIVQVMRALGMRLEVAGVGATA